MTRPILVVTGGRNFANAEAVAAILTRIGPGLVIQGGATGADALARAWCEANGVDYLTMPALWTARGKGAGPKRNAAMIEVARRLGCRLCLALPGGTGTEDCTRRATAAGMEIVTLPTADDLARNDPTVKRAVAMLGGVIERVEECDG